MFYHFSAVLLEGHGMFGKLSEGCVQGVQGVQGPGILDASDSG
jgi:hypothetical protein